MASSWNPVDSDDDFENAAEARYGGKTALLVVIDSTPTMFKSWKDNEETPFLAAIKCCEAMWRSKVVSNAKDLVSIVLVGTETSKNTSSFPNLYQLQELSSVTVDMIKQLIEMKSAPDSSGDQQGIGSSESYDLKDLFWLAKIIFDEGKTQTFSKKILYFTCEDNPHDGKPNLQEDTIKRFKDLGKIDFNVVTFKEDFQFDKFYSKLTEDDSAVVYSKDLSTLMKVVHMKQRLKRTVTRSTLQIATGVKIGIGFYSFVRQASQPKFVNINKRNNEIVEKTTKVHRLDTGMPLLKSEERKMVNVQGEQAVFTPQEVKTLQYIHEPGIKLIGFLSKQNFDNFTWYRAPGYFMYPDDDKISGSKELFTALLKRCQVLEKVPLVRMVLSRGRSPKLACLIPSIPDDELKSVFPQGFHVFNIPFADEMRKYEMDDLPEAPPELVALMEKVVKKLTNKNFDVLDMKNPSLQSKWKHLEEEALEERFHDTEDFFDYTEPNEELMNQRLGTLPSDIDHAVQRSGCFSDTKSTAPVKKCRVDVAMEAKHGRLEKLTCEVLKGFLESNSVVIPFRSKKVDLISEVKKHLGLE